ncbi:hypothetical protein RRG08_008797 [Elysia crispata]|uniref:Uncharacterized protein n=1 Tax=Elysia crispata TaxID=231223 RepID=A0AAE0Z7U5_9GAST|nr:hypothetical protein RRG08_008797 [Elysia crispata]
MHNHGSRISLAPFGTLQLSARSYSARDRLVCAQSCLPSTEPCQDAVGIKVDRLVLDVQRLHNAVQV